ncbi:pentatricopeptide repeat domain-containing protein (PPR motif) [Vreelandella subterranea]|uniref:Pentatricopeptide repeat domain-containing protein (PPR motif) n=1 Tax=Vreelandella subterranea TaxID=416874 RepID=A0A1H9VS40_9GAMM|nr:hypothetical protein [Halomonas subterranea]SES24485.1 pentatricopeptide repeat domain-containing protein (PPR motif) [Halomonas subterranea]
MGWLKKIHEWLLKKPKDTQPRKAMNVNVVVSPPTAQDETISSLHKEATAAINEKDFEGAVERLQKAYAMMVEARTDYPIERYLRLPNYLQQAGRMEEAEAIFQEMLSTWQQGNEKASIHNQMRIAYGREKRFDIATVHGMHSILWRCISYTEHRTPLPKEEWATLEHWKPEVEKLLKRTKQTELLDQVLDKLQVFLANPDRDQLKKTADEIESIIQAR